VVCAFVDDSGSWMRGHVIEIMQLTRLFCLNNLYKVNGCYFLSNEVDSQPIDGIVDILLAQTGEDSWVTISIKLVDLPCGNWIQINIETLEAKVLTFLWKDPGKILYNGNNLHDENSPIGISRSNEELYQPYSDRTQDDSSEYLHEISCKSDSSYPSSELSEPRSKPILIACCQHLGSEPVLPYLSPAVTDKNLPLGANFASAGIGILNDTGFQFAMPGHRAMMKHQTEEKDERKLHHHTTNTNLNKGTGIGEYVWKDVTMLKATLLEIRAN
nr:GDSL esterase/lipase At5g33370-like [Tanacetum cinerariifolium]